MAWEKHVKGIDEILLMPTEELAYVVLQVFKRVNRHGGKYHVQQLVNTLPWANSQEQQKAEEVQIALAEAVSWLKAQGILVDTPGQGGNHGWMSLSRKGAAIDDEASFRDVRVAAQFPRELIHPSIAKKAWLAIARGDFAEAVFSSFRAVEIAVRESAPSLPRHLVGTDLMRSAFSLSNGPLLDQNRVKGEQESMQHLFAGAVGLFKNPHSHRAEDVSGEEARELVMFASYLLRLVEMRRDAMLESESDSGRPQI